MRKVDDRLALIQCLHRVAALGSLSAAARELDLSPAAVSLRIARLERQLGISLLSRHARGVALTSAGQRYVLVSTQLLSEIDALDDSMAVQARELRGELHIDTSGTFAQAVLMPLLANFMSEYPAVWLRLQLQDGYRDLSTSLADLAIRIGPVQELDLIARRIHRNRRILVAAPSYVATHGVPESPASLGRHRAILLPWQRQWSLQCAGGITSPIKVEPPVAAICDDGGALSKLASLGVGIALKSLWDVLPQLQNGELVQVLAPWEEADERWVYALYGRTKHPDARVGRFLEFLVNRLQERLTAIDAEFERGIGG